MNLSASSGPIRPSARGRSVTANTPTATVTPADNPTNLHNSGESARQSVLGRASRKGGGWGFGGWIPTARLSCGRRRLDQRVLVQVQKHDLAIILLEHQPIEPQLVVLGMGVP